MTIDVVQQVVGVLGAVTGAVLLGSMVVAGWVGGGGRPEPVPVRVRR